MVSPDEINRNVSTVIIALMTSKGRALPSRVACRFEGRKGLIVLDQMRTVDKSRLLRRLGRVTTGEQKAVLAALAETFAE